MSTAKPKRVSAAVSETLDFKTIVTTGDPSVLGGPLGQSRLQRGNSAHAIKEATQCVIENGFTNRGSGGGGGSASSYGEQGGYPTQSSLNDIAREVDEEDETIASRMKRDRRYKKLMKYMAKTVVEQRRVQLAKLVTANDFESALDEGTVYTKSNAWSIVGGDVEHLTAYDSKVDGGLREHDTLFQQIGRFLIRLSDSLFLAPQSDLEKNQNAVRKGLGRNAQIRGVFGSP
jgi:hypothetical protein